MRGKWLLISGAAILAAVAAGALSLLWRGEVGGVSSEEPAVLAAPSGLELDEVSLPGRIQPRHVVEVHAPVEGILEAFLVEVGEEVYEGELLADVRSTGLSAAREALAAELERLRNRVNSGESRIIAARLEASRARADASRVRSEFERVEQAYLRQQMLLREGATPRLVYEQARREYELAKLEYSQLEEIARFAEDRVSDLMRDLDAARRELAEATEEYETAGVLLASGQVYSPVDGLVVARSGLAGDVVGPETAELYRIAVQLAFLEAVVEPEPPVLDRIRTGEEAWIQLAEFAGEAIPGRVREVRDSEVFVEFVSPTPAIRPGLTAQVRIKLP